ncbi:peptidase U32 family protein [Peribacillus castrilensis]|uniref:U32 family peptidase n=3 Tax=Peribacillus TaxID=2675229 RepID=A0AAJ1QPQ2_9BACI|nr:MULTISPECIES: U32 family peptidase [Bacillaceae]KOR86556.1 protease [Bacillus sp. FJAT-22058]KRF49809.1 protease [Bacillus sp. Soil745]MBD8134964.1 U32 family peptidase [Bacillus sp. CFBP 13597]MBL3642306.1 U32 family peptidase [Bacillus sp. RHFB]MCD1161177.1 U32 family peptidase [Peribacillus castrilensis]MCP1092558.1 U32 family peptidase [Bacillaceae bacterium OS4b]MDP9740018.1 putative protease [Bacillus sp. B2I3]PEF41106.1 collagenase-like protease [Bacillus sp. AFS094228]PEO48035.1
MNAIADKISKIVDGKRVIVKKPELLAPAGNLEKLKIAVHYGADAVFIGGQEYGLRSNAGNFTFEEMKEGVEFANKYGAKVYVTTNIFAHNENIDGLDEYLEGLQEAGVHGIIVADPLIIETCKRVAPKVEIHLSTQQSLSNWKAVQYWKEEGLERVVLARETSADEIREMKEKVDIEIEAFVHGAMCIAYSGRCTLSNHMTARDSNRGGCCQSCRWDYDLYELDQDGEKALFDKEDAPFAMSPKDLKLIESLPGMIEIGIDSLKVEGRMKSIHYIATVVSVYRKVIDAYCADPDNFKIKQEWLEELDKCANRETASSFMEGEIPGYKQQMFGNHTVKTRFDFAGLVLDYNEETKIVTMQQRNFFKPGDEVEFFGPEIENFTQKIGTIWDESGKELEAARHPLQIVRIQVDNRVYVNNMMRKEN